MSLDSSKDSSNKDDGKKDSSNRRQPSNLQGLLRYAIEAKETAVSNVPDNTSELKLEPMSEDKKQFLEEALQSMTVNISAVLRDQIAILSKVETLKENDDISVYTNAFDTLLEYVDDIDIANDFYKVGGFNVLRSCLKSKSPEIKALCCSLIAELAQNNPFCQRMMMNDDLVKVLLHILNSETGISVSLKALHALSCIVRGNAEGYAQLIQYGGLDLLLKLLRRDDDRYKLKIAYLLNSLCQTQGDLHERLVFLRILDILIPLITEETRPSREHVLDLMLSLVERSNTAVNECRKSTHNLKGCLQRHIESNEDEVLVGQYTKLWNCLFSLR